jgi:hypothetical protein
MALKFEINAEEILSHFKDFRDEIKKNMEESIKNLVSIAHTRIVEAADELSSANRKTYNEALSGPVESTANVWVIALDGKAMWIEEGIEPNHDMKPDLLKGQKYRVIPFHYDRPTSHNSSFTQGLISEIKQKLKKEKLSISKIENNPNGSARTGKLHEFNFGGPKPGRGNTPALARLTIYQHQNNQTGKVRRDVLTFRTVSSGPASEGKWIHPGYNAKKFIDKAMDQAIKDWEDKILPEIVAKWSK